MKTPEQIVDQLLEDDPKQAAKDFLRRHASAVDASFLRFNTRTVDGHQVMVNLVLPGKALLNGKKLNTGSFAILEFFDTSSASSRRPYGKLLRRISLADMQYWHPSLGISLGQSMYTHVPGSEAAKLLKWIQDLGVKLPRQATYRG